MMRWLKGRHYHAAICRRDPRRFAICTDKKRIRSPRSFGVSLRKVQFLLPFSQ